MENNHFEKSLLLVSAIINPNHNKNMAEQNKEDLSPEMREIVEEVEKEESQEAAPKVDEVSEKQVEKPKEDLSKEELKEGEKKEVEVEERVTRMVPVKKLQDAKKDFKAKIELSDKRFEQLSQEIADLKKNGVTKEEKKDDLEELAEKYDVPTDFLKDMEKVLSGRLKPKETEKEIPAISEADQAILNRAKQDEQFEEEFKESVSDFEDEDKELFNENKAEVKKLAFTKKYAEKSLAEIYFKAIKPEVTGKKSSEDISIAGAGASKSVVDINDRDIEGMSDKQFEEYMAKMQKRSS